MEIEIKGLRTNKAFSEETTCYQATIYVDGKAAFAASNDGHGGCDFYRPLPGYDGPSEKEISDWLKANKEPMVSHGMTLEYDLELFVGELIEAIDRQKTLARMLKSKIVVMIEHEGAPALASYPARFGPTPENIAKIAAKGEKVVNGNAELEAAALALV